jgi:hypothetical protein
MSGKKLSLGNSEPELGKSKQTLNKFAHEAKAALLFPIDLNLKPKFLSKD